MRLILDSGNYQCIHCQKSFLYSESLIDVGLFFTMFGIALLLLTFTFDSQVIDNPGVGPIEMLGYVVSVIIIIFGLIFIHISK
jgi:hypothetical protein